MVATPKTKIRNLTILIGSTLTVLAGVILAPGLPEMALAFQDVPNGEFLVRLSLTIPALFVALAAPFMGLLIDRWGRKPVLVASLTLYGLAGTSGFVLDSLFAILASRAILGIAIAGTMIGFTTLIADYFTGSRLNQFMGYQGAAIGLGGIVFVLLGGYLADFGWRFPFLIHLSAFLVLPGVWFAVDEPEIRTESAPRDAPEERASFPLKSLAPIYAIAFAGLLLFFVFILQLPFYLTAVVGVGPSLVGLALSLQALVAVLIALQYRRLKARLSFQGMFVLIFLTIGISQLIVAATPVYGLVVVGLLIAGIGLGALPPSLNLWVISKTPSAMRGRALSGLTAFLFLGQFFTPVITEPIVGQVGLSGMFGVVGGVSLSLAVVFVWTAMKQRAAKVTS